MLPSLTFRVRRLPARRLVVGTAGGVLLLASIGAGVLASPQTTGDGPREKLLRDRLAPSTWALAVPLSWLEAPVPEVRRGDSVDLIAVRSGDRPLAIPLAADLLVMDVDDRSVIFEVDEDSASAIASAHASSLQLVPLLRSTR